MTAFKSSLGEGFRQNRNLGFGRGSRLSGLDSRFKAKWRRSRTAEILFGVAGLWYANPRFKWLESLNQS